MADIKIESNMYFINAPAGSGKTHFIKDRVNIIVDKDPSARILCITYTDRAAKELKARILSDGVYISTIHSFINFFVSPYFAHSEAIEMYFELYKNDIENRIMENNSVDVLDLQNKNSKYLISRGIDPSKVSINIDIIKENTTTIYYNERSYNTLYYGGLSHDNLLHFTFSFLDKYPVLQLRLREMFQYIFVDEVQDTNTKILSMFYNAVKGTSTKLYYFGDKMQEIYDNYDGEFEKEYKTFDSSLSKEFIFNYRSSSEIVNVLNNLYGRKGVDKQKSKSGPKNKMPKLIICPSVEEYFSKHSSEFEGYLLLRIANRARFARNNPSETMENIFNAISNMYPHGSKVTTIDVMLPVEEESPDILVNFFYIFDRINSLFNANHYAEVIRLLSIQNFVAIDGRKKSVFQPSLKVVEHADKQRLKNALEIVFSEYSNSDLYSLESFMMYLITQDIIASEFLQAIKNEEDDDGKATYEQLLNIQLSEMKRLIYYKNCQSISTQHGVKGEGHNRVCFWSEDSRSNRPYVYMYDFFRIYTQLDQFDIETFQDFYYMLRTSIMDLEKKLGIQISKLKSSDITNQNIALFDQVIDTFKGNLYFDSIFKENIPAYAAKRNLDKLPTLKSIQAILKAETVNRILVAYKLFYVGCSRAKDELVVLVGQEGIQSFESSFKDKMISVGFDIFPKQQDDTSLC